MAPQRETAGASEPLRGGSLGEQASNPDVSGGGDIMLPSAAAAAAAAAAARRLEL